MLLNENGFYAKMWMKKQDSFHELAFVNPWFESSHQNNVIDLTVVNNILNKSLEDLIYAESRINISASFKH